MAGLDFSGLLLHGVLGLLLFAGSMHLNIDDIAREKWLILVLATLGVAISTVVVGVALLVVMPWLGLAVPLLHCLLFGALISPTDPVAVLAVIKRVGVPKSVETRIAGESLFNDGTGVVVFLTLLALTAGDGGVDLGATALLFATEVVGGMLYGLAVGYLGFRMLRAVDSYAVEIMITLALCTAGYAGAEALHVSAPIAVVLMGLIVGNRGKREAMSEQTRQRLFDFWEVLDELLNLLLFGLIGLEMMTLTLVGFTIRRGGVRHRHRPGGTADQRQRTVAAVAGAASGATRRDHDHDVGRIARRHLDRSRPVAARHRRPRHDRFRRPMRW